MVQRFIHKSEIVGFRHGVSFSSQDYVLQDRVAFCGPFCQGTSQVNEGLDTWLIRGGYEVYLASVAVGLPVQTQYQQGIVNSIDVLMKMSGFNNFPVGFLQVFLIEGIAHHP